jgi:phosphohistidine phosphatase
VKNGIKPDLFISSPANRALETAHLFAEEIAYPKQKILLRDTMYNATDGRTLTNVLRELDASQNTVALFGHEPTLSEFTHVLSPRFQQSIPKSGVVGVQFDVKEWTDVFDRVGDITYFDFPLDKDDKVKIEKAVRQRIEYLVEQALMNAIQGLDTMLGERMGKKVKKASREFAADILQSSRKNDLIRLYLMDELSPGTLTLVPATHRTE